MSRRRNYFNRKMEREAMVFALLFLFGLLILVASLFVMVGL